MEKIVKPAPTQEELDQIKAKEEQKIAEEKQKIADKLAKQTSNVEKLHELLEKILLWKQNAFGQDTIITETYGPLLSLKNYTNLQGHTLITFKKKLKSKIFGFIPTYSLKNIIRFSISTENDWIFVYIIDEYVPLLIELIPSFEKHTPSSRIYVSIFPITLPENESDYTKTKVEFKDIISKIPVTNGLNGS